MYLPLAAAKTVGLRSESCNNGHKARVRFSDTHRFQNFYRKVVGAEHEIVSVSEFEELPRLATPSMPR